jgi:hypothetical protein
MEKRPTLVKPAMEKAQTAKIRNPPVMEKSRLPEKNKQTA